MKLTIIPLQDLLAEDGDYVTQSLANFFCAVNKDVEYFLRNSAIEFENRDLARTYLVVDENMAKDYDFLPIIAYFSLTTKAIELNDEASKGLRKDITTNKNGTFAAAYLIAQLAKNDEFKSLIDGKELLELAMDVVKEIQKMAAGRIVYLECRPVHPLVLFYESCGFKQFQMNNSLVQMYKRI